MTANNSESPKHNRRWFQFSLRTLLLVMLLSTFPMAWVGYKWREHEAEQKVVDAILKLGGRVSYRMPGKEEDSDIETDTKLFWRGHVRHVILFGSEVDDAGLVHLLGLTQLQELSLGNTQISDAGLVHLKGLTQLQELYLHNTQISDTGLVHLRGLTQLQRLILDNTQISDASLVHLRGLTQLQWLSLGHTQISDAGLVHLQGLTQLQSLDLDDTRISDAGLAELQKALPQCSIQHSINNPPPADGEKK